MTNREELTSAQAVMRIAPALRMVLGEQKLVRFAPDESLEPEEFGYRVRECELRGVLYTAQESMEDIYERVLIDKDKMPQLIGIEKLGVFAIGESVAVCQTRLEAYANRKPIEKERQTHECSCKRLSGKIAIVTGSAQGFGDGIAREMMQQGAYMVIADLNMDLAQQNANDLCATYGEGKAIAVKVDVSDEASVENLVAETVQNFGGLDIFVSNAGVLKAGSLQELSLRDFEFVTKVNYTAFFICAKVASMVMQVQNRFATDYLMDIIQINSKSGLEGSNKNFAYAGSKFGGIGLVQSFAKELVAYGIKVNAICPGNFLEGPLWMDPERGLFVQYLRASKVPGAKTVEEVKRFYEAKVPLNRGCFPKDVAKAIFYCVEQDYETGQAIPVTGGQNMLK